jgi:hypothetical protein
MTESAGAMLSILCEKLGRRNRSLEFGAVKIDATGDSYDFSPNLGFDHYRRRRNLLLGHRQVCHRPPACKSAEAARDPDLPRRHFAASAASDGNLLRRAQSAPNDRYQPTLEGHHVGISHRPLSGNDHLPALSGVARTPPRQKKPGENEKAFCLAPPVGRSERSLNRRLNRLDGPWLTRPKRAVWH